ncbi:MAG: TonB-dependent receptor [Bryobacteraceae bacterium]
MRAVILLALGMVLPAAAQVTTGSITGYALDPANRPIAGAKVTASDTLRATVRVGATDSKGLYYFADLPPAIYAVDCAAANFGAAAARVEVAVNANARVDFHLAIAARRETVTVESAVHALQTESGELGTVIDQSRIDSLPLNERDFLQLALLTPGVLPPVQNSELSTRDSFAMHANGGREEYNDYLLDGVDNNDQDVNRYVLQPSVDTIQEFKIATNSYSAEYGRNAGGQVNVITRSGTNDWHGFAYDYLRNRDLDARNYFDGSSKPEYIRNQFGGGLGGSIVKNRTFFFVSYDSLRELSGLSQLATVPTAAERAGNLSGLGTTVVNPYTQAPFPGDTIPASMIDPLALKILAMYPLPNLPGTVGNYLAQPIGQDNTWQFNGRLDERLTDRDQLTLRYSYGHNNLYEPYAENSTQVPGYGDYLYDRGHNALIHYERVFSPTTINSLVLGLNLATRLLLPQNYQTNVNQLWGVNYLPTDPKDYGFPSISVAGLSPVGDVTSLPINRHPTTYQVTDALSTLHGNHALKVGVEYRGLAQNGILDVYGRGSMSFAGALSGSGIGDLLLGLPTFSIQSTFNNTQTLRTSATNAYFQDDWKVAPRLTLNLGLRYEFNAPPTDPTNRMSAFDFSTGQLEQVGTNGLSRSGIQPDYKDFAPRVGFAWSITPHTVMRGGYGIYYDAGMVVVNSALYFNPPYFNIRVFFPSQNGLLTLANPFPTNLSYVPPPSLSTLSPNLTTANIQAWNYTLQRELPSAGTLTVSYAGSKGTHLIYSRNINQPPPEPGDPTTNAPNPNFGSIDYIDSGANSSYNSLQVTFNRPLRRDLSVLAAYTYSKSIDDTSAFEPVQTDQNFPQNDYDYHAERALSSFDMRNRLVAAYVYRLPFRNRWLRNFENSGIITAQSGQPFTPMLEFDNSNTGNTGGAGNGYDRPNVVGDWHLANPSAQEWFNTAAFAIPPQYTFGDAGRNILIGPGLFTVDTSLSRRFQVGERSAIVFEAQAFNALNRVNFQMPQNFADVPSTFGHIFSANPPRQIQFALRYSF